MRNRLIMLMMCITLAIILVGCSSQPKISNEKNNKLTIVTTLFPQYDFTRQIVGDRAEVIMLLNPGVESHSYEPTPADIIKINEADIFVYTGKYMEPWAENLMQGIDNKDIIVVDASANVPLGKMDETEHDSEEGHSHEDEEHGHEEEGHRHDYDPHIWTDPNNAKIMVDNIAQAIVSLDPNNAEYYNNNTEKYKEALDELDKELKEIVDDSSRKEIVFGGHFALHYFTKQYGLKLIAAYDSLSSETEPSVRAISSIIDKIKRDNIPVIYYEELTDPKVAKAISHETGAKMLLLHSAHNVSKDELQNGITYLSIMKQNGENLKEGLR